MVVKEHPRGESHRIEIVADWLRMIKAQQSSRVCALLVVMPRKKANTTTGLRSQHNNHHNTQLIQTYLLQGGYMRCGRAKKLRPRLTRRQFGTRYVRIWTHIHDYLFQFLTHYLQVSWCEMEMKSKRWYIRKVNTDHGKKKRFASCSHCQN